MTSNINKTKPKLLIVVNVDWFFLSHRLPIAIAAMEKGYSVTVMSVDTGKGKSLEQYGIEFIPLPMTRSGMNIFSELRAVFFIYKKYKALKPDIIHHVAMKPVMYGSICTRILGIKPVVNALSGMGYAFSDANKNNFLIKKFIIAIYKIIFRNSDCKFLLQNNDDLNTLQSLKLVPDDNFYLIKGSGIKLADFPLAPEPESENVRILLPARMLWDKGVGEFYEAAKILKPKYGDKVAFILAGGVDLYNRALIPEETLKAWNEEGFVEWIGHQTKMAETLASAHIIVLPSYREGFPKSLIEASAVGRPIVTTDVPGCREAVVEGGNGFIVPKGDARELAVEIEKLIVDKKLRLKMGAVGRQIAERDYTIENVIQETFRIYSHAMGKDFSAFGEQSGACKKTYSTNS